MNSNLNTLVESIWNTISVGVSDEQSLHNNIETPIDGKRIFKQKFIEIYNDILDKYMEDPKGSLDRHKVAAIIMVAIIKSDLVRESEASEQGIYFGKYALAADCGLDYLLYEINRILLSNDKPILDSFSFPNATSCSTPYFNIFFRNLYYADTGYMLNPLDLAERLFLLEQITIRDNNLDVKLFKEC
ncbi:hypothetical protein AALB53_22485 [Lachnospiraceae bacterium 47-T17]